LLPPGPVLGHLNLEGFASETSHQVAVGLDKDSTLSPALHAAVKESITVTGAAPVIDTTSTTVAANLEKRTIQSLPPAATTASVVQIVPGVTSDAQPRQHGSVHDLRLRLERIGERLLYRRGQHTTGAEYGWQGKELNFEFIEAVDVKTGGYEAEYGRSIRGHHQRHHQVVAATNSTATSSATTTTTGSRTTPSRWSRRRRRPASPARDYGIGLGGYIKKDKLWFFGAYDRVTNSFDSALPEGPRTGQVVVSDSKRNLGAGKLTLKLTDSQSLTGTFFQDPARRHRGDQRPPTTH